MEHSIQSSHRLNIIVGLLCFEMLLTYETAIFVLKFIIMLFVVILLEACNLCFI